MTKDEALKLALEALEEPKEHIAKHRRLEAIIAIKEALAQPEQEPLEYWNAVEGWVKIDEVREHFDSVGCGTIYKSAGEGRAPLYTTPPQRKPLTDEQLLAVIKKIDRDEQYIQSSLRQFARAIETAHGIKGEA